MPLTIALSVLFLFAIVSIVISYNGLVVKKNAVDKNFAQIDVLLRRRHDLIDNFVETVKGYAAHEKTTFENVAKARSAVSSAKDAGDRAQAENMLTGALKSLFAVSENYPQLKANENFMALQNQLAETEDQIAGTRQTYNSSVMQFNVAMESFPSNMIAGMFNFKKEKEYLEITEEEKAVKEPPKVKFT